MKKNSIEVLDRAQTLAQQWFAHRRGATDFHSAICAAFGASSPLGQTCKSWLRTGTDLVVALSDLIGATHFDEWSRNAPSAAARMMKASNTIGGRRKVSMTPELLGAMQNYASEDVELLQGIADLFNEARHKWPMRHYQAARCIRTTLMATQAQGRTMRECGGY